MLIVFFAIKDVIIENWLPKVIMNLYKKCQKKEPTAVEKLFPPSSRQALSKEFLKHITALHHSP